MTTNERLNVIETYGRIVELSFGEKNSMALRGENTSMMPFISYGSGVTKEKCIDSLYHDVHDIINSAVRRQEYEGE